jgi:hypothetical protein
MNQEHSKKPGASAQEYTTQPSKAPHQDEPTNAKALEAERAPTQHGYHPDDQQGISNRPAKDEHAFPDAPPVGDSGDAALPDDVQSGGNRGGV